MQMRLAAAALAIVMLPTLAAAQKTSYDYNKEATFASYKTYGLKDGTKMTLRPETSFAVEKFSHDGKEEAGFFRLIKGGVRAITGLIGKRNPQGMRVSTTTATIGIRGTSFDARLCEADCAAETRSAARKDVPPSGQLIVARVATHSGTGTLIGPNGQTRGLSNGAPLFSGDTVRTDKGSYVVVAFRDRSKFTVVSESEFKLENVRFTGPQSDQGNLVVRVIKGGVRALTGLLAKREPKADACLRRGGKVLYIACHVGIPYFTAADASRFRCFK